MAERREIVELGRLPGRLSAVAARPRSGDLIVRRSDILFVSGHRGGAGVWYFGQWSIETSKMIKSSHT
jgi:hypothetical protein